MDSMMDSELPEDSFLCAYCQSDISDSFSQESKWRTVIERYYCKACDIAYTFQAWPDTNSSSRSMLRGYT